LLIVLTLAAAAPAAAQREGAAHAGPRVAMLRSQVERAFMQQARKQLGLTSEQAPRMERVVAGFAQTRVKLDNQERGLMSALREQERTGTAANADSTSKLVSALQANRVANAESFRDEMAALAPILTPVQLGRYQLLSDRLLDKIRELQQTRVVAPDAKAAADTGRRG
jgi:Spy/CpxP family protein refolding chaperone